MELPPPPGLPTGGPDPGPHPAVTECPQVLQYRVTPAQHTSRADPQTVSKAPDPPGSGPCSQRKLFPSTEPLTSCPPGHLGGMGKGSDWHLLGASWAPAPCTLTRFRLTCRRATGHPASSLPAEADPGSQNPQAPRSRKRGQSQSTAVVVRSSDTQRATRSDTAGKATPQPLHGQAPGLAVKEPTSRAGPLGSADSFRAQLPTPQPLGGSSDRREA